LYFNKPDHASLHRLDSLQNIDGNSDAGGLPKGLGVNPGTWFLTHCSRRVVKAGPTVLAAAIGVVTRGEPHGKSDRTCGTQHGLTGFQKFASG